MKLSEIQDMWTKDAKVNELDLGKSSIQIAELHAKYLNILSNTKLQLRKCEGDYLRLRRTKFKYYRGEMTREELEELGWSQFQGLKPLKNEVEDIVNCDEDIIRCVDKVEYMKAMLYQLEQIIRSLNGRGWEIKNAIEWTKFTNGLM
jgi:phosphoglycerate-specific signal transduction histidine kinase